MSNSDQIQRLMFDDIDVRGVVVGLKQSYQQILARADYPDFIQKVLGEMLAAVALLTSNLKIEGRLSLQAAGEGGLRILMTECNHKNEVRGIARFADDAKVEKSDRFDQLLVKGRMVLTIEPESGQRYQGVVPLEGATVAECIQKYFAQSEQLATYLQLSADGQQAGGLMLQVLPASEIGGDDDWSHILTLAATLSDTELLALDNETLLYRLFHQENVRLFDSQEVSFKCGCSRQRSANALQMMTEEELLSLAEEQGGEVDTTCQFCNEIYRFDTADIRALFKNDGQLNETNAVH